MRALSHGVPGVNAPPPTDFEGFYAFYLSQHLHPATRRAHVAGMTLGWSSALAALITRRRWLLLGLPVFGYGFAIPSHYLWEGNKPASFMGPRAFVWSIGSDLRQLVAFYTGHLDADVAAVRAALDRPGPSPAAAETRAAG